MPSRSGRTLCRVLLVSLLLLATSPALAGPRERGNRNRRRGPDNAPSVGDKAPSFKLPRLDRKGSVDLADFKGKQPVVLIFGSYT